MPYEKAVKISRNLGPSVVGPRKNLNPKNSRQVSRNVSMRKTKQNFTQNILADTNFIRHCTVGAFLQTPAPAFDSIIGPMSAGVLSSSGLDFGTVTRRSTVSALDKNWSPNLEVYFKPMICCDSPPPPPGPEEVGP